MANTLSSSNALLDLAASTTPERYRLVDCAEIVNNGKLKIHEYVDFPVAPYAAVSYVWRGNTVEPDSSRLVFSVKGAEDADPIGLIVLTDACAAALARGVSYLWLDRLCISQTSTTDKRWQIRQMYRLYQSCAVCIVVPGGLQRLIALDEETEWIHRGWTLQEALAPPIVLVLFSWKLNKSQARSGDDSWGTIEPVTPHRSAMAPLSLILDACTTGYLSFELESGRPRMVQTKIFSTEPPEQSLGTVPFWQSGRQIMSPNVSALAIAMSQDMDVDIREHAIWQSALMRTSSRPVDMVFSIMGLFGVTLDPRRFEKHDRLGATIALAQAILNRGGKMSWLGISCLSPPSPHISTFPAFPHTRVAGKALVRVQGGYQVVSELMLNEYPNAAALVPAPQGHMDDDGYVTFTARAIRILPLTHSISENLTQTLPYDNAAKPTKLRAVDGSNWSVCAASDTDISHTDLPYRPMKFLAVLVGFFNGYYPGGTPAQDANNVRAMLVEEHSPHRFHLISYFMLSLKSRAWAATWPSQSLTVGGPEPIDHFEATDEQDIDSSPRVSKAVNHDLPNLSADGRLPATLKSIVARQARWAVPQEVLERSRIRGDDDDDRERRMESYMRRF
ncbi:hypothetical protein FRC07_012607 [Ceratobasidium sp. 392]|nr:hypothetical protein FRC07_012607 [Ceratobasidium sp. 392]